MLFIIFVLLLPLVLWLILHVTSKRDTDAETASKALMEECALCRNEFLMSELLEKEVGNYGRIYCFCGQCIENLYNEYQQQTHLSTGE